MTLNTPDFDPNRGVLQLPNDLVDQSGLIAQECAPGGKLTSSSFIATGRGGLPPNPTTVLGGETVITRLATLSEDLVGQSAITNSSFQVVQPAPAIVEAQGWIVDPDGGVSLVAETSTAEATSPWLPSLHCQSR